MTNGYGRAWQRLRLVVLDRDRWTCHWCGGHATTVDHVKPKIEGGTDAPHNLVACCRSCNSRRSIDWHNRHPHRTPTTVGHNRWATIRTRRRTTPPATGILA